MPFINLLPDKEPETEEERERYEAISRYLASPMCDEERDFHLLIFRWAVERMLATQAAYAAAKRARQAYERYCSTPDLKHYDQLYQAARQRYLAYQASRGRGAQIPAMHQGRIPLGPPVFDWPSASETTHEEREYWVATGAERGDCGHHHKTEEAARLCADKDMRACSRVGGASDRKPARRVRKSTVSYSWPEMLPPDEYRRVVSEPPSEPGRWLDAAWVAGFRPEPGARAIQARERGCPCMAAGERSSPDDELTVSWAANELGVTGEDIEDFIQQGSLKATLVTPIAKETGQADLSFYIIKRGDLDAFMSTALTNYEDAGGPCLLAAARSATKWVGNKTNAPAFD
jgi:hypothetical protein